MKYILILSLLFSKAYAQSQPDSILITQKGIQQIGTVRTFKEVYTNWTGKNGYVLTGWLWRTDTPAVTRQILRREAFKYQYEGYSIEELIDLTKVNP